MATKALSSAFFPANYVTLKQLKEKRENEERRCLQLKEEEEKAAEAAAKRQNSEHEPQRPPKPRAYHQRWIPTTKAPPIGANATASAPGVSEHRPPPAGRSASNLETTPGREGPKKNQRKKYRKNKKKGTAAVTVEVDRDVPSRSPPRKAIEEEAKAPVVDKASEEDREAMATGGAVAVVSAIGRDLRSDDYSNADPIASEGPPPNGGRRSDWNRGPPMRGAVDRGGGGGGRLPASGLVWVRKNPIA